MGSSSAQNNSESTSGIDPDIKGITTPQNPVSNAQGSTTSNVENSQEINSDAANDNHGNTNGDSSLATTKKGLFRRTKKGKKTNKKDQSKATANHKVADSASMHFLQRLRAGGLAKWKSITGRIVRHRLFRYGVLLVMGFTVIWIPALTYVLKSEDVYKSNWSLIIPGSGLGSSLNIDSIGQTTTSVASPYASSSVDPKVNYKAIIMSSTVLNNAAASVDMTKKEYGKPLIKLIDQTAIMQVTIADNTADKSHNKSVALFESLDNELNRLRKNERSMIDASNTDQLEKYRQQVENAQQELLNYQTSPSVASSNKLELSLASIDRLNNRRSELQLLVASKTARQIAIEQYTQLTNTEATYVVKLQQDIILKQLQETYAVLYSEFLDKSSTLGARNPKVASPASKLEALTRAIETRTNIILGNVSQSFIKKYSSVISTDQRNFYLDQITLGAELVADANELAELDYLVEELEVSIKQTRRSSARLGELEQASKVAETIYLSTLAKQDLGKSDVFASYPMVQLLVPPIKPFEPEKLHRIFAIIGALMGSSFVILALVILWKREALLRKLSKKR